MGSNVPVMNESTDEMIYEMNHEVTGSNPVEVLTSSFFSTHLLKLRAKLRGS